MSITIEMPKLSDTMTDGVLVKWHKAPGDTVEIGDVIAEVETDKAVMEMEAFDEGVLDKILVQEGDSVQVGAALATLRSEGESTSDADQASAPVAPQPVSEKTPGQKTEAKVLSPQPETPAPSANSRVKASPLARKLAAEKNIDLAQLKGSGPGGRVVAEDVEAAAAPSSNTVIASPAPPAKVLLQEGDQRIPLSGMRRIIAERLQTSKREIPHFYLEVELDVSNLLSLRSRLNANAEKAGRPKITINDFVLFATAKAISQVPAVNATFDGDAIVQYPDVHLAVAVALEEGLVTPVIRQAQHQSLSQISAAVRDLAGRARSKKLPPEAYQGGTFTVSNLGSYGIDRFFAIINPPQAAILSVGSIVKKPVVNSDNQIVIGQRMTVGLSADHRVIDGAIGAQFLAALRELIENPLGIIF
jgi:pyruvate dehydrogenase E2 component (dihydrolipoamide acetyltransferase)